MKTVKEMSDSYLLDADYIEDLSATLNEQEEATKVYNRIELRLEELVDRVILESINSWTGNFRICLHPKLELVERFKPFKSTEILEDNSVIFRDCDLTLLPVQLPTGELHFTLQVTHDGETVTLTIPRADIGDVFLLPVTDDKESEEIRVLDVVVHIVTAIRAAELEEEANKVASLEEPTSEGEE